MVWMWRRSKRMERRMVCSDKAPLAFLDAVAADILEEKVVEVPVGNILHQICSSPVLQLSNANKSYSNGAPSETPSKVPAMPYRNQPSTQWDMLSVTSKHCDPGGEAKKVDFGLAKRTREESHKDKRGTLMYLAPESAARRQDEAVGDIWVLWCTALEMVSGLIFRMRLNDELSSEMSEDWRRAIISTVVALRKNPSIAGPRRYSYRTNLSLPPRN